MYSFNFFLVINTKQRFQHDQRNRLTRVQKGLEVLEQSYDDYGRLADNPKRGEYHYTTSRYVLDSITLNASGLKYYKEHPRQDVQYNMDRKAVSVHEHEFGWADFAYNAQMQRTHAWYGGEEENLNNRTYQKHYSSLFPAEITVNNETGKTDIVHYIGGDGYTAPLAKINDEIHYLHRDYLGSLLAITDGGGNLIEERQFSAWGEVDFFKQNGVEKDFSESILPRGFTGHEHFSEIALIHMNGRMYDPQMRRFLSPDNNIPDPFDTRSFDRFGYAFHNPLMNVDPTGEELATILLIVKILYAAFKVTQTTIRYVEGDYRGPIPGLLTALNVVITFTGNPFVEGGVIDFGLSEGLNEVLTLASTVAFFELNELAARNQPGSVFNKPLETMVVGPEFESNSSNSMNSTTNSMESTTNLTSYGSLSEEIPNPFDPYNQESFLESSIPNLGNITIGGVGSGGIGIEPFTVSPIGNGVDIPEPDPEEEDNDENPSEENTDCEQVLDCPEGQIFDTTSCACKIECPTTTGYLHTSAFGSNVVQGANTLIKAENFRDELGAIIVDTNCETGKIYKDEQVNVLNATPETRTYIKADGTTDTSTYYPVEFKNCEGNQPDYENYDPEKPCSDCDKGNPLMNMKILPTPGDVEYRESKPENGDFGGRNGNHKGVDVDASVGTPIYAQFDGEIVGPIVNSWPDSTGDLSWKDFKKKRIKDGLDVNDGGNRFYVKSVINGVTYKIGFFHIKKDGLLHASGTKINKGDLLGYTGQTGTAMAPGSGGAHLHNEFWENQDIDNKVDPKDFYYSKFDEFGNTTNPCN